MLGLKSQLLVGLPALSTDFGALATILESKMHGHVVLAVRKIDAAVENKFTLSAIGALVLSGFAGSSALESEFE